MRRTKQPSVPAYAGTGGCNNYNYCDDRSHTVLKASEDKHVLSCSLKTCCMITDEMNFPNLT